MGVDSKIISAYMAKLARRKAGKMTREQRSELARKMNRARWAAVRKALVQQERQS